jgi:hypothetical protein
MRTGAWEIADVAWGTPGTEREERAEHEGGGSRWADPCTAHHCRERHRAVRPCVQCSAAQSSQYVDGHAMPVLLMLKRGAGWSVVGCLFGG